MTIVDLHLLLNGNDVQKRTCDFSSSQIGFKVLNQIHCLFCVAVVVHYTTLEHPLEVTSKTDDIEE